MKTNNLRNKLVVILSALMMLSAIFGLLGVNNAKADGNIDTVVTSFTMEGGQSVRLAQKEGDPKGMRFIAHLSADSYEALNATYDSVEYGYFIMPKYYKDKIGDISKETTFDGTTYGWEGKAGTYTIIHNVGAAPVLDEKSGDYLVRGSVVGMKPENLAIKYTGKMYIKATKGESVEYKFADALENSYSMIDVAIMAMDIGVEDDSLQAYIDDYKAWYLAQKGVEPTYSYAVNYVAGSEVVKTDVVEGNAINTNVSITATAPEGYVLDTAKSANNVLSGKVYADNNLTLTVYVKANVALTGSLYNGELYHFEKRAQDDASVVLPQAIGSVNSVKIGDIVLDAETYSYDDETKTLTVNQGVVAGLATGDVVMTISNATAIYTAQVTVADVIVNTESELYSAFEYISGAVANHCTDYIILGNDITCETVYTRNVTAYRMGIFDGKGHVISNLNVTKPFTASLQSVSTFKNVVFLNATNASTSGFLGADSGTYEFDNVAIIFKENRGGGLVNYSAGSITFTNSMIIDLNSSSSQACGYISRTNTGKNTHNFTNSCVISDKAPFDTTLEQSHVSSDVYKNALAMRIATNAESWFKSLNGEVPSYLDSKSWSFDQSGNLCYNSHVVIKNTIDLVGEKNNGELFYFSKDITNPTGYASAYVSDNNYNVTLPVEVGTINSVKIAGAEISGFAYADKVLSIPVSAISSIVNGVTDIEIDASSATYKATVTIASVVIKSEQDLLLLTTKSNASSDLIVLDGDITWTKTYEYERAQHLYGTVDGKGYAIKDMVIGKTGGSSMAGLFNTFQGGWVKNLAMINVDFGSAVWRGGVLAGEVNSVNTDNVFISISRYVGANGLVHSFAGGTSRINNTIVYYPCLTGTAGGFSTTYGDSINVIASNSFVVTPNGLIISTENTSNTNVNYAAINELACADYTALKTASNNFANFDSNYWSVDASGNLCFGGNVVINA